LKSVTGIENLTFALNTGAAVIGANAQAAGISTVDMSSVTGDSGTLDATNYTSSVGLTIKGSNVGNDVIKGGAGNDTISTGTAGTHAFTGRGGADMFTITTAEAGTIADLGNGSDNFTLSSAAVGGTTATVTANYTAGASTKNNALTADAIITASGFDVNMSAVTLGSAGFTINGNATAASLTGSALADVITGGDAAESLVGGTGDDTIVGGLGADTISTGVGLNDVTGGAAADIITLGSSAEQVIFTAASTAAHMATESGATAGTDNDFAAGTIGDQIISFTSGSDKLNFKTGIMINDKGTEVDTLATIAAAGVVANTNSFVEITTAVSDGTMGVAITQLNGLTTDAIEIGDTFVAFQNDGTDGYLYLVVQASAADTIAAADVTLIGQLKGVTNVADGDFTSLA
jgi:hypothetical protein